MCWIKFKWTLQQISSATFMLQYSLSIIHRHVYHLGHGLLQVKDNPRLMLASQDFVIIKQDSLVFSTFLAWVLPALH